MGNESKTLRTVSAVDDTPIKKSLRRRKEKSITYYVVDEKWVSLNKPAYGPRANKAVRGSSLLIAGSKKFLGAGVLAARAALRAGSGYSFLAHSAPPVLALKNPDFIVLDLDHEKISKLNFNAVGIGPGLGVHGRTKNWLKQLRKLHEKKVVVDADAITVCAREKLFPLPATWVATPHTGELSRVLKVPADEIEKNRFHFARLAQQKMGCQVLLKGHHSILATATDLYLIPTGNNALAKSGTGDVLTGMITSFMAQGLDSTRAALIGAYLHGAVADDWVRQKNDPASFLASDLIEGLPQTMNRFRLRRAKTERKV